MKNKHRHPGLKWILIIVVLSMISPLFAQQKEPIRIIGSPWPPGFFEIASDVTSNHEWIYVADMNNSKIQVYNRNLSPLFHFGGYGFGESNFIEIRGLCAGNQNLLVASIDSFASREGRIQSFTTKGIFIREFDKPSHRSDFLRVAELDNKNVAAITEQSLCIFSQEGKLLREVRSVANHTFLTLQDIVSAKGRGLAFLDRSKRGFFVADAGLTRLQHFGEEYINIPMAIDFHDNQFIVADANGDLLFFDQNGRYLKVIPSGIFPNGIQALDSRNMLITSPLRKGIVTIDMSTGQIQDALFEPRSPHQLHWPEQISINSHGHIYTNDDYVGGLKYFSLQDNAYLGQSAWLNEKQTPLHVISSASSLVNSKVFVLSRTNLSHIYIFESDQLLSTFSHSTGDHYTEIQCDHQGNVYALDSIQRVIRRFNADGQMQSSLEIPSREYAVRAFAVEDELMVLLNNGSLLFFPLNFAASTKKITLERKEGVLFSSAGALISWNNHLFVSFRDHHLLMVYDLSSGKILESFGTIGGPNTFPSKENLQVDIAYQAGRFLFPSSMSLYNEKLYIADAGNHRIQIIPLSHFLGQYTVIQLKIGEKTALINGKSILLDAAPFILSQRTMVPLRFIAEAFGAEVGWDNADRKITIVLEGNQIVLWIQQIKAQINLVEHTLDAPPVIVNQRTFVPIRFIAEAFESQVEWDGTDQSITVRRR